VIVPAFDVEAEGEDATAEEDYNTINNWKEETELTPITIRL
jgi:hypothetical protein